MEEREGKREVRAEVKENVRLRLQALARGRYGGVLPFGVSLAGSHDHFVSSSIPLHPTELDLKRKVGEEGDRN
jgi:hypothetical protein